MGKLDAALQWAARGFPVFPVVENGKEPAVDQWEKVATTDPALIRLLWTDIVLQREHNYNIGVMCNDKVVVDIDIKKGKDGYNEYTGMGGTFDTLVVRTPSGGLHVYFNGPDSSNSPLSNGVDIRSHNGYVLAPGSFVITEDYQGLYETVNDKALTWVPENIERNLTPLYSRGVDTLRTDIIDDPASIQAAINFLQSAPIAVEGQRGDECTFVTAARLVREMALSTSTAFYLMRDYWNGRCAPPWELPELLAKVENAAAYGSAELGRLSPEMLFGGLNIPEVPNAIETSSGGFGNAIMPTSIPPRPWLMDKALMHGAVTLLLASGSAGKSSISLAIAAHLALGLPFAGYKCYRPCKTIIYNGEDDLHEQSRRLLAMCIAYEFDYYEVKNNVMLLSSRELKMDLVAKEYNRPVRNDALIKHIVQIASNNDVGLIIIDPLVKIHKCNESDNVEMDFVMETLTDIAHNSNTALLALHHTAKTVSKQEDRVGNMDIARGASAVVNAARIAFTLLNASQQDAEDYGFQDNERHMWVRLDDAKMNISLATKDATWFHKEGVRIPSNDLVGVLRYMTPEKSKNHIKVNVGILLLDYFTANNTGEIPMPTAIAVVRGGEPLWANRTDAEIRKDLEYHFSTEVDIRGRKIVAVRDGDLKKNGVKFVYR